MWRYSAVLQLKRDRFVKNIKIIDIKQLFLGQSEKNASVAKVNYYRYGKWVDLLYIVCEKYILYVSHFKAYIPKGYDSLHKLSKELMVAVGLCGFAVL